MALTDQALCQLADVKTELGITVSTFDTTLERMIEAISQQIANYCRRTLHYTRTADESEDLAGFNESNLTVSRAPIVSITSITLDGSTIDSDAYEISDADAGLIYREDGWVWTASFIITTAPERYPGSEDKDYTVAYRGGYVTANQVVLDNTLTRNLPYDLEDAAIRMVAMRYLGQGRDLALASEKIGQAAETYRAGASTSGSAAGIPDETRAILDRYRRAVEL